MGKSVKKVKPVKRKTKSLVKEVKPVKRKTKSLVKEVKPVKRKTKTSVKEVKPVKRKVKPVKRKTKTSVKEVKPVNLVNKGYCEATILDENEPDDPCNIHTTMNECDTETKDTEYWRSYNCKWKN